MFGLIKYNSKEALYDAKISISCIMYFIMSVLNSTIKVILPDHSITSYMSALSGVIIICGFLYSIMIVYKRSSRLLLRSYALFFVIYLISYILIIIRGEPATYMIKGSAFVTFCWWIPMGVYASSVINLKILYDYFLKASYVLLFLLTLMFLFHPLNIYGESGYNMFFGFNLVIPTLFHINELVKTKKIFFLLLVMSELLMMIAYANRGCWIPVLFFLAYTFILKDSKHKVRNIFLVSVIVFLLIFLAQFLLEELVVLLEGYGITSRTLEMLIDNSFASDSSNRDIIWQHSKDMIVSKPLIGWGLGGEFYHLAILEGNGTIDASFHPHNGIIQNFVNFGVLGGFIASLIIIFPFFKLSKIKNTYQKDLCLIFGSCFTACFYSASGFFILPTVAIFLFLYYRRRNIA